MAFDADFHAIAYSITNLLDGYQPFFDLGWGDALPEASLAELVEGPDLHGVDFIVEQASRQCAGVFVPGGVVLVAAEANAGVVGGDFGARLAAQQVIERRAIVHPHDVPQRDFKGGERARLCAGIAVVHDIVHDKAPESFDIKRVLAQHERRDRAVQRRFGARDFVDCLAQADDAAIGVYAHGEQTWEGAPL